MIPGEDYNREVYSNTEVHKSLAGYVLAARDLRNANSEYAISARDKDNPETGAVEEFIQAKNNLDTAFMNLANAKKKFHEACKLFIASNQLTVVDHTKILSKGDQIHLKNVTAMMKKILLTNEELY